MKRVIISRQDFYLLRRFALAGIHSEYYSGPPEYFSEAERLKKHVKKIKPVKLIPSLYRGPIPG